MMGIWYEIKPRNLPKREAGHQWLFAQYIEAPSEREDGRWYHALLFRNVDRTLFGIKEFDELVHFRRMEQMARRVVREANFRENLLSDDPDLPKIWKRR